MLLIKKSDKLNDKGKESVIRFLEESDKNDYEIKPSFYCPECETRRETELEISFGTISGDSGKTFENCQSFYFRCPECFFDLGGGTLRANEVNRNPEPEKEVLK
jgi:hypothetical protein